jgi:hypothetical protein
MLFDSYGVNLQNPVPSLLEATVPDPGKMFGNCDQSGAEALIVAHEAEPGRFMRLFQCGIKPHVDMALNIFLDTFRGDYGRDRYAFLEPEKLKVLPEWPDLDKRIKKSGRPYDLGKRTIHAKNYDMKWPTFRIYVLALSEGKIVLTSEEAKQMLKMHETLYPEIKIWQQRLIFEIEKTRMLRNLFGYPRRFDGSWNSETERELLSFLPQSTVGCITHIASRRMYDYINTNRLDWQVLGNKHDSYLMQFPIAEQEHALSKMREFMEQELTSSRGETYRMRAEVQCGFNAGKYDPATNPNGLKEYAFAA